MEKTTMDDPILKLFDWLTPLMQRNVSVHFAEGTLDRTILDEFRQGWGKTDSVELLNGLTCKYGPQAGVTVEKFLSLCIQEDWAKVGREEAHPGTEIDDFFRILWEPLRTQGFEFTSEKAGGTVTLAVNRCPVYELAEATQLHQWLYHLACATDFYSTCAFSPRIAFARTKTLMEGHGFCNHTYSYKENNG
jgi:hypothetical protein